MRARVRVIALCAALVAGAGAGCGPIEYVNTVTRGASSAVDAARAANAAKYSPYWWTRAVEYLHKAREEAGYADFQAANRFGRLAEEAAIRAREEALRRAADPDAARELDLANPRQRPAAPAGGLAPVDTEDSPGDGPDGVDGVDEENPLR